MALAIQQVLTSIADALDKDELVLPTLPEVALRVRDAAADPNTDMGRLSKEINSDAALSARIIKVANSPLLRTGQDITDIKMATMRLGMDYTVNIATALAMEQMFQATSDIVDKRMRQTWLHSSEVAGLCHVLCKHKTSLKTDMATLGGLVHQIGILPILSFAEERPAILKNSDILDSIIEKIHPAIGDKILQKWEFPKELRHVPTQHLEFNRSADSADYADIVTVATLQIEIGREQVNENIDYSSVTSFGRLGLEPDTSAHAEDINEEIIAAMAMLN